MGLSVYQTSQVSKSFAFAVLLVLVPFLGAFDAFLFGDSEGELCKLELELAEVSPELC